MWAENARGGYWGAGYGLDKTDMSNTIMPMNINRDIWHKLISKDKNDIYIPEKNIEAGIILLGRIRDRIRIPTPAKIGAIWNFTGFKKTNDYGTYIEKAYTEKPWAQPHHPVKR